jgi:phospholipid-binding lipoprotein MlaA
MGRRAAARLLLLTVSLCCPGVLRADEVDPLFADEVADAPAAVPDPFERGNRMVFGLNLRLDRWVFDPVTRAYAFVVPDPVRRSVRRVLANLGASTVFVNDVLQLAPTDAAVTAGRFAVNTTVGVVGVFDVASRLGLPEHVSDFGQTLALYGMPSGPYLVIPAVGPTTVRDAAGYVVDLAFRPATYFLGPGAALVVVTSVQEGGAGIAVRDANAAGLRALRESSIDFYAALRSAWTQDRMARIWARRQESGPGAVVRRLSGALARATPGGEVGDAGPHQPGERGKALALED